MDEFPSLRPLKKESQQNADEGRLPPNPAKLVALAAGLEPIAPAEQQWLKTHPGLLAALKELQTALDNFQVPGSHDNYEVGDLLATGAHHSSVE